MFFMKKVIWTVFEEEIKRFEKFQSIVLGGKGKQDPAEAEVNIRTYVKYLLKEGTVTEKRELLGNLRSRLVYQNKSIALLAE